MAKKIRVEFELDLKDVVAMMQSGTTKTAKLSAAEVEAMAKSGALRAGDILTKKEAASLGTMIAKIKLSQQVTKVSLVQVAKVSPAQVSKVASLQVSKAVGPNNPTIVSGVGKGKTSRKS